MLKSSQDSFHEDMRCPQTLPQEVHSSPRNQIIGPALWKRGEYVTHVRPPRSPAAKAGLFAADWRARHSLWEGAGLYSRNFSSILGFGLLNLPHVDRAFASSAWPVAN
jgi:hypothetical protein